MRRHLSRCALHESHVCEVAVRRASMQITSIRELSSRLIIMLYFVVPSFAQKVKVRSSKMSSEPTLCDVVIRDLKEVSNNANAFLSHIRLNRHLIHSGATSPEKQTASPEVGHVTHTRNRKTFVLKTEVGANASEASRVWLRMRRSNDGGRIRSCTAGTAG